jgi:hypothetical protein
MLASGLNLVDPVRTAVTSIHPVDESPLACAIDWVLEFVYLSLGFVLMDAIPWALIWSSAGQLSWATVNVTWSEFPGLLFDFLAGHVSWSCLPAI